MVRRCVSIPLMQARQNRLQDITPEKTTVDTSALLIAAPPFPPPLPPAFYLFLLVEQEARALKMKGKMHAIK